MAYGRHFESRKTQCLISESTNHYEI